MGRKKNNQTETCDICAKQELWYNTLLMSAYRVWLKSSIPQHFVCSFLSNSLKFQSEILHTYLVI